MKEFIEPRIGDKRLVRLLMKWLKAGVMVEGLREETVRGTPQGGIISPLLSNIYLHYGLDLWTHAWRQREARQHVYIVLRESYRPEAGQEGRNIELALERRLCDTIGEGCQLTVTPYESKSEIARWQRLGFILMTPERQEGYLHLSLGAKSPRVVAADPANSASRPTVADVVLGTFFPRGRCRPHAEPPAVECHLPRPSDQGFWDIVDVNNGSGTVDSTETASWTTMLTVWASPPCSLCGTACPTAWQMAWIERLLPEAERT